MATLDLQSIMKSFCSAQVLSGSYLAIRDR